VVAPAGTTFDIGDDVRLSVVIKVATVPTDPTDLQIQVKEPDGTVTSKTLLADPGDVINDAVGQFHYDHTAVQTGAYAYKWTATGAAIGAEESSFVVKETEFD